MNVRFIALLAAVVPFLGVHLSYLVAAGTGVVDWCIPYWDSCTSISATGRYAPASYIFRATMLPAAVFIALYWACNGFWLSAENAQAGQRPSAMTAWMVAVGMLACIGLILYVTVLGEPGDVWRQQRRIGTVLFFSLTFIAQLLLVSQLKRLASSLPEAQALAKLMWWLCLLLLLLGVLTVALEAWDEGWYETVEDAFEWILTLLLQTNFFLGYLVWRACGWSIQVTPRE
jgi:hypothetical protein